MATRKAEQRARMQRKGGSGPPGKPGMKLVAYCPACTLAEPWDTEKQGRVGVAAGQRSATCRKGHGTFALLPAKHGRRSVGAGH